MNKLAAVFFFLFICIDSCFTQHEEYAKVGASLKELLANSSKPSKFISSRNNKKTVSVFIETNSESDGYSLRKNGYTLRTIMGDVATANIPLDKIYELAKSPLVKRIELPLLLQKEEDTLMRKITTVQEVLNGEQPLDSAYKGDGILIGIIDDGADISHPDFYDANNKLRIKYLWNTDYNLGNHPAGYDYGTEWQADSMEYYANKFKKKQFTIYQMQNFFGYAFHGTSVTSLAAGNDGVAPHATIVSVALTATIDTLLYSDRVIDGIAYIYSIAQKENKKCVINISLGTTWGGPHDGKTLLEKAIDNFCYAHPYVLVCTSVGNSGNDWKHWGGFPIDKDSSFGFFRCSYKASLYFSIPKNDSKTLNISIGEAKLGDLNYPNISRDSVYYQSPFLNIDSLIQSPVPAVLTSYLPGGQLSSYITFAASHYNDDYDELIITTDEKTSGTNSNLFDDHLYRFIWKGTGTVHAWYPFFNLHPIFFFGNNPYPNDSTYHNTDNDYSTVIPTNAFTVLSSGAYNLRTCYVNIHNNVVNGYEKCRTTYFTSHGPTLDGRIKPDVISPGDNVFAARSRFDDFYDFDFIIDTNTVSFGGTSASSPITAGIAALAWEKYPELTREQVINLIKSSANFDSYCSAWGNKPNNIAGWGKVDAFKALAGVRIRTKSLCLQNDDCTIKGNGDSTPTYSNNYFSIYPNPVQTNATIYYVSDKPLQLFLFDVLGKLLKTETLPASEGNTHQLEMRLYAKGVYFIRVTGWEKPFTKKIIFVGK
jgi:minor extracellular serine protease Vpr